jgi:membrane protein DedA with SNARE-associated domain
MALTSVSLPLVHHALPGFLAALEPLLSRYGYFALFGIIGVESFGVPAPGQSIMIAAAVYAGTGNMSLPMVALVSFVAATLGDNVGYAIGRFGGRTLIHRFGRYVGLTEARLGRMEDRFARHGAKLVVVARFVDGLRQFNGVLSGLAGMPWSRFLVFNAIGAALWVAIWCTVGRLAGHHLDAVYHQISRYQLLLIPLLVLVVAFFVGRHLWHRRKARAERERETEPVAD